MTHGAPSPYVPITRTPMEEYEKLKTFRFGTTSIVLPALKVNEDTVIYVLNIMGGNPAYIVIFATELLYALDTDESMKHIGKFDGFISAEGKSIHLVYEIASQAELPYTILRKIHKPYMGKNVLSAKVKTITTGEEQLYLDNRDLGRVVDKRLIFVDDVISSGATLNATKKIVELAGGEIVGCLAMALEGDYEPTLPTYALGKLPVIKLNKRE